MYTTGTTGESKGVKLSHENVVSAINNICDFVSYGPKDKEVVVLPLSHNFGLGHVYCNLRSGGSVYTEHGLLRVNRVLKKIESFEATGFPTTPSGVDLLTKRYGAVLEKRLKNLKFSIINSAPLSSEQMIRLQNFLPDLNIFVYYGMTEASRSTFISLSNKGSDYYASVGKAMNGIQVTIRNENGDELPSGTEGEVSISGPTVSAGYWNNLDEDVKSFRNGELLSGDLGLMDDNGYLYITGRKKDQINVGGYKVNPVEVEEVVQRYPGVLECAVCSVGNNFSEVVALGVVVEDINSFELDKLLKSCNGELENWKIPQVAKVIDSLPRTNTGKIKRQQLSEVLSGKL
jgi:long-chain acyl-CoA synthetase